MHETNETRNQQSCIAIQGLADAIIYGILPLSYDTTNAIVSHTGLGLNERTWTEWMKLIFPEGRRIRS